MKKNSVEISEKLIEMSEIKIKLEKKRLPLVTKKKQLVQQTLDINGELQKINSEIEINKKEIAALKHQRNILHNTFDQRDAERFLYRSCLILKGVLNRGIALEAGEEKLIEDIEKFLNP